MKTITKLLLVLQVLLTYSTFAQSGSISANVVVVNESTGAGIPQHMVFMTIYPDSLNLLEPIHDSALTDESGFCQLSTTFNFNSAELLFSVGTYDCNGILLSHYFTYTGQAYLVNDSLSICQNNAGNCDNFITINSVYENTVSFSGALYNQQPAEYSWDFGDGSYASGADVVHTYSSQGIFLVSLHTVTNDSCTDISQTTVILQDSTNNDCINYFTWQQSGLEFAFSGYVTSQFPSEFSWNFGDPASGDENFSDVQNPVHTFSAEGIYTVSLSTSDSSGCTYTSTLTISVFEGNEIFSIFGQAIAGNSYLDFGTVKLFKIDSSGFYSEFQSTGIDSSFYFFGEVPAGTYIIQALPAPNSIFFGNYLPTYYQSSLNWENATPIVVGPSNNPYNIDLISYDSIAGGPGIIGGQIINGDKSTAGSGIEVLLLNENNEPVRLAYTDNDGKFTFAALPLGIYHINPELAGYMVEIYPCTLTEQEQTAEVTIQIQGNMLLSIKNQAKVLLARNTFPNPASSEFNIQVADNYTGSLTARIYNSTGMLIHTNQFVVQAGEVIKLDVNTLPGGFYTVILIDSKGNSHAMQLIKK